MTEQPGRPKYYRGAVAVSGDRIALVSDSPQRIERYERERGEGLQVADGAGRLVMPGLINLHNHVSMTLMRGYADDLPLMPWLTEKIWPFEAKLDGDDIYSGAELGIAEMLLGGTTAFVDMYWYADRVAEAAIRSGIRAVVSPAFVGTAFDGYVERTQRMIERYNGAAGDRIRVWVAPHAPYTCTPEQIRESLKLCERNGVGVNIHVAETLSEVETIRERYGKTPVEHLRDLGVFDYRALAVHCVHLTETDMEILPRQGVSVVYNPQSNMKLASGIAPVARLLERGANVGIGTDGPSSNNDLDMWDEMRTGSFLQKVATGDPCVLPAYEVLRMATTRAADAIGMKGEIGVLAEGARADLIVLNLDKPHLTPCHDLVANLVYCAKPSDVETVMVDGRIVVRQGALANGDFGAIRREVERRLGVLQRRGE